MKLESQSKFALTVPALVSVVSHPGPDPSITEEDLKNGKLVGRRYRNRRIGEFLKELKFTEGRGTGVPKMLRVLRANGSPEPIFLPMEDA